MFTGLPLGSGSTRSKNVAALRFFFVTTLRQSAAIQLIRSLTSVNVAKPTKLVACSPPVAIDS
jgi:hypothetical protein